MTDDAYEDHVRDEGRRARFLQRCCANPRRLGIAITCDAGRIESIANAKPTTVRGRLSAM